MDCKYTQNYLDFFSSEKSEEVKKTFSKYHELNSSFESFEKLNETLKKIYSNLKKQM